MYVKVRQRLGVLSERQMGSTVGKIELTWTCVRRESGCLRWSCQARGEEKDQRWMDGCNERGYKDGWCKSRGDTRFGLRLKQMVICESCKELIG